MPRPRPLVPAAVAVVTVLASLGLTANCAHRRDADFARTNAAAGRAYGHGRYGEAAELWLAAASAAPHRRDADEARYRAAASLARGGRGPDAARLYEELAADPEGERAARAAFERAELELDTGRVDAGIALRDRALRTFPDSGLAGRALRRQLTWHVERGGAAAALAYLDSLDAEVGESELAEAIDYERAAHLELAGDREAALAAYLAVAQRFPYPFGVYWDDAIFRAAELEVALGRPRDAIAHLERMLDEREAKPIAGSLERPRFGPARFLIAEILRDELHDPAAARREFLRLVDAHPTSRLRDDALWSAATLGASLGDPEGACRDARRLARDFPDSRYVGCLRRACPELGATTADCPSYVPTPTGAPTGSPAASAP